MTAVTVSFIGTKVLSADTLTAGWIGGPSMAANTDTFVEGTQSLSEKVSAATATGYTVNTTDVVGEPWNLNAPPNTDDHIFAWLQALGTLDTLANGGLGIVVADDAATDAYGTWYVGPQAGYLGGWNSYVINPAEDFDTLNAAGTPSWTASGNPDQLTGVDGFGCRWKITSSIMGASDNAMVDAISVGTGYRLTGGDGADADGKFSDFVTYEENTSNRFGALRSVSGIPFLKCKLRIGAASGSANTVVTDSGFTLVWEAPLRPSGSLAVAATFYALHVEKGTGTTDVTLSNGTFQAVSPAEVYLDFVGSTSVTLTNVNAVRARLIDLDSNVSWTGGIISSSGTLDLGGSPTLSGVTFLNPTDTIAMEVDAATELDNVDNITFDGAGTGGAGSCAIRLDLGAVGGASVTLTNVLFRNRVSGSSDIVIPSSVTGHITINVTGGDVPTVDDQRTPDDYEIVADPVTVAVNVKDNTGTNLPNARVLLKAASGGPFPFNVTVTITRSGSTATVAHTGHGLATNDKVVISGANEVEYNGVYSITVTGVNEYTYTVTGTPATPATGTIKSTFVALHGLTDSNGNITTSRVYGSDQPVTGWVRKSTTTPSFKEGNLGGSVDSATGYNNSVQLVIDT